MRRSTVILGALGFTTLAYLIASGTSVDTRPVPGEETVVVARDVPGLHSSLASDADLVFKVTELPQNRKIVRGSVVGVLRAGARVPIPDLGPFDVPVTALKRGTLTSLPPPAPRTTTPAPGGPAPGTGPIGPSPRVLTRAACPAGCIIRLDPNETSTPLARLGAGAAIDLLERRADGYAYVQVTRTAPPLGTYTIRGYIPTSQVQVLA